MHAFPEANAGHLASLISYAVFSGLACALSFFLADTVGFPLPENFEDVRRIKRNQKPLLAWVSKEWQPADDKPSASAAAGVHWLAHGPPSRWLQKCTAGY